MHDPVLLTGAGAIPLRMRKPIRSTEPDLMAAELERLGVPVLGRLPDGAWADGGDRFWLDDRTMAIGLGYRTNAAGAAAVAELVAPEGIEVVTYDLPHDAGPDHVLHLQSLISAIALDLLVVYEPLMPVRLLEDLRQRGYDWIAVAPDEYLAMGCNVLCVRPGVVVMADGADTLRDRIEARGVTVHTYDGSELSLKGDGGPTCLTCPILRAD
jgi:N-dimethylarginine dimethylaminohydrolase